MTNLMVAYARFSEPQIPMSMYIGISTISKNAKKSSRSSARKTPSRPVSRMSMATMNCFGRSLIDWEAATANGNRTAVSSTIHSEIPSTPTRQPIPRLSENVTFSVNWKSGIGPSVAKLARIHRATPRGTMLAPIATGKLSSGRRFGSSATTSAPKSGEKMRIASTAIIRTHPRERGATRSGRRCRRRSSGRSYERNPTGEGEARHPSPWSPGPRR